jgi:hypothetical protein
MAPGKIRLGTTCRRAMLDPKADASFSISERMASDVTDPSRGTRIFLYRFMNPSFAAGCEPFGMLLCKANLLLGKGQYTFAMLAACFICMHGQGISRS